MSGEKYRCPEHAALHKKECHVAYWQRKGGISSTPKRKAAG